jgi:hypothetical protein
MTQRKLNILFLLLISVCFLSCTKFGKNVTIEGRVVNPITGQGISGATGNSPKLLQTTSMRQTKTLTNNLNKI